MQAGIQVRLMLWYPTWVGERKKTGDLSPHVQDHFFAAEIVQAENERLMKRFGATATGRSAARRRRPRHAHGPPLAAAHHQKLMIVRTPWRDVGFCGGVDLAYTRRDAPGAVLGATGSRAPGSWADACLAARDRGEYLRARRPDQPPGTMQVPDLPGPVYGRPADVARPAPALEGDVVQTLEWTTSRERWALAGRVLHLVREGQQLQRHQVIRQHAEGVHGQRDHPTRRPRGHAPRSRGPPARRASTSVQMWRTIPLRSDRTSGPHQRGEFTVMAGIAEACQRGDELIWIFDQYLWSGPFGLLLHRRCSRRRPCTSSSSCHRTPTSSYEYAHKARFAGAPCAVAERSRR